VTLSFWPEKLFQAHQPLLQQALAPFNG
jgi:hypothetical protein